MTPAGPRPLVSASFGLTLDTGALIALERRHLRALRLLRGAMDRNRIVTVPSAVVAEWWRGRSDVRDEIRRSVRIEPMDEALACAAGEALAAVRGSTVVDAVVAASAARRGDLVLTADLDDLGPLAAYFGGLRLLAV